MDAATAHQELVVGILVVVAHLVVVNTAVPADRIITDLIKVIITAMKVQLNWHKMVEL